MATRVASAVLTMFLLAGCAATTPAPRFSAVSPADAAAPESGTPPPELSLAAEAEVQGPKASEPAPKPAGGHEGHSMATPSVPEAEVYSCPMHPEVKQPSPGSCPKCGMALVKRKDARQRP